MLRFITLTLKAKWITVGMGRVAELTREQTTRGKGLDNTRKPRKGSKRRGLSRREPNAGIKKERREPVAAEHS